MAACRAASRVVESPMSEASLPAARILTFGRQVRPVTYPGVVYAKVTECAADRYEDFTISVTSGIDGRF